MARFTEASLLVDLERFEEASDVMVELADDHTTVGDTLLWQESKRMLSYIDILAEANDDGRSAYELDSSEVTELDALIGPVYDRPSTWMSNLLCAVYGHCRPPITGGNGVPKARRAVTRSYQPVVRHGSLAIVPNPASTCTNFAYVLKGLPVDAWLTVRDLAGRAIHRVRLAQHAGVVTWDTQDQPSGVYMVTISENGNTTRTEKLIVQP